MYSSIGVESCKPRHNKQITESYINSRIYTRGRLRRLRRLSINTGNKADVLIVRRIKRLRLSASNR